MDDDLRGRLAPRRDAAGVIAVRVREDDRLNRSALDGGQRIFGARAAAAMDVSTMTLPALVAIRKVLLWGTRTPLPPWMPAPTA